MSRNVGQIEVSKTNEDIEEQYAKFSNRMVNLYDKMKSKDPETIQLKVYTNTFKAPEFYMDISEVMDMALSSMVRTHCEAVVEGMGRIVNAHSSRRH